VVRQRSIADITFNWVHKAEASGEFGCVRLMGEPEIAMTISFV
jgi:hypothetical protein